MLSSKIIIFSYIFSNKMFYNKMSNNNNNKVFK